MKSRPWTPQENAVLDRIWDDPHSFKIQRAADELGRSWTSVKSHVSERHASGKMAYSRVLARGGRRPTLSDERVREMIAVFEEHGAKPGARILGCGPRDLYYVVEVAKKRGIPVSRVRRARAQFWTKQEDAILSEIHSDAEGDKIRRIAKRLDRSERAVRDRIRALGLNQPAPQVTPARGILSVKNRPTIDSKGLAELIAMTPRRRAA